MFKTLDECIHYIENQIPQKIDLSLSRIRKAAELLGNPQNSYRTIHITGTNGKGSTASFTAQLLSSQGLKVGLFTSPHLVVYNERMRINQKMIADADFIFFVEQIIHHVFPFVQLTVFECLTLVGYLYFANQQVDVAVIEVGLGGRYDATNIIEATVACVTNISVDHVHFLSNNTERIAFEKAGIFKSESINLHTVDTISLQHILQAEQKNVQHIEPYINYTPTNRGFMIEFMLNRLEYKGPFPMFGTHQIRNLEAALKVSETYLNLVKRPLQAELFYEQLSHLSWKGRMERLKENVYFDGAHNTAGIEALIQTIETHFQQAEVHLIFSVMKDKEYEAMLQKLNACSLITHVYFLPLTINRSLDCLPSHLKSDSKISEINLDDVSSIINQNGITIFAGSLYGYAEIQKRVDKEGDLSFKC